MNDTTRKTSPKISAIIPIYPKTSEKQLQRLLKHLADQSLTNYEAVFVVDAGCGRLRRKILEAKGTDERIRCFRAVDGADMRATGLSHAKGRRVIFLRPEFRLKSDAFETLESAGRNYSADIVMSRYSVKKPDGEVSRSGEGKGVPFDEAVCAVRKPEYLKNVYGSGIGMLYRRKFLKENGIAPGVCGRCIDVSFIWRALLLSKRTVRINYSPVIVSQSMEYPKEPEDVIKLMDSFSALLPEIWKIGDEGLLKNVGHSACSMLELLSELPYNPGYKEAITDFLRLPPLGMMAASKIRKMLNTDVDSAFEEIEAINKMKCVGSCEISEDEYMKRNNILQNKILNRHMLRECIDSRDA